MMEFVDIVDVVDMNLDIGSDSVFDLLETDEVEEQPPAVEEHSTEDSPKEIDDDERYLDLDMPLAIAGGVFIAGIALIVGKKLYNRKVLSEVSDETTDA